MSKKTETQSRLEALGFRDPVAEMHRKRLAIGGQAHRAMASPSPGPAARSVKQRKAKQHGTD